MDLDSCALLVAQDFRGNNGTGIGVSRLLWDFLNRVPALHSTVLGYMVHDARACGYMHKSIL